MADLKISGLPASTTPLAGTEVLPIVQSSTTKQVSVANLTAGRTVAASNLAVGAGASASGFSTTLAINRSGGGTRGILFQDGGSDQSGLYTDSGATGTLYIFSNGTRPISVSVNGVESLNLDTSNNVKFSAGNLIQGTAAKGINFTANTPAAGMTSQLLNWYEEGTWTPTATNLTVVGTPTYTGRYTRIGRVVFFDLQIHSTTSTASTYGSTTFTLPFTQAGEPRSVVCAYVGGSTTAVFGQVLTTYLYSPSWVATDNVWISGTYSV